MAVGKKDVVKRISRWMFNLDINTCHGIEESLSSYLSWILESNICHLT
jgi:hypothetical protein